MNNREFVTKLKRYAGDDTVRHCMQRLASLPEIPPISSDSDPIAQSISHRIRNGAIDQHRKSKWFLKMSESDQAILREVLEESIEFALFNVLTFIDGVGGDTEGVFEIVEVVEGRRRRTINPENTDMLHDLLSEVYAEDREAGQ